MVCIHCTSTTRVVNSRPQKRTNQIWRRRQCDSCHAVFSTHEVVQYDAVWLVKKSDGSLEPFSRDKLFLSLYRSCQHRPHAHKDAAALVDTVIAKLLRKLDGVTVDSRVILHSIQVALTRFDRSASTHYSAFHQMNI